MSVNGDAVFITGKYVAAAAPVALDTIDFLIPAGLYLCTLEFFLDDADSAAAFLFGVGYRAVNPADAAALPTSAAYFAAAGQTTGQAGGSLRCAFKPIQFDVDVYIQLLVSVAPTSIVGNPEIHMIAGGNQVGPR
jgi:hypothetical protein